MTHLFFFGANSCFPKKKEGEGGRGGGRVCGWGQ